MLAHMGRLNGLLLHISNWNKIAKANCYRASKIIHNNFETIRHRAGMNVDVLGNSRVLNWLFKPAGTAMESNLRKFLMNPVKTLENADFQTGQTVLEVGSVTGLLPYRLHE